MRTLTLVVLALVAAAFVVVKSSDATRAQAITSKVATGACVPVPPGMVAWLPGDGNVFNLRDTDNARIVNAFTPPFYVPAKVGLGFRINPAIPTYVSLSGTRFNEVLGQISFDAWVMPNTLTGAVERSVVTRKIDDRPFGDRGYRLTMLDGGQLQFIVTGQDMLNNRITRGVTTISPFLQVGVFTHVAASFDPGNQEMKIYVNGVDVPTTLLAGSVNIPVATGNNPNDIQLGNNIDQQDAVFDGIIDEFQLFGRVVSQPEFQSIVAADSIGTCKPSGPCGGSIFGAPTLESMRASMTSSATGDFNGDGNQDLSVYLEQSQPDSNTVLTRYGNGDGTFSDPVISPVLPGVAANGTSLAAGDVNNDGFDDLLISRSVSSQDHTGTIVIMLGNATGAIYTCTDGNNGPGP